MKILENEDLGKLILRLSVAALLLFYGVFKLLHGVDHVEHILQEAGSPAFFAYGVYVGEIIAPILLILGVQVRVAAGLIIFTMLNAIVLVNMENILSITPHGGWKIEIQMFYILASLAIVFLGEGKYRLKSINKREKDHENK